MRSYLCAFRLRRKMELQYRGAMIGGIVCQVVFGLILIALYRALYDSKPQALPLEHVVTYVWLQQAFFRMLLASDPDLLDKIRTGGIAYDLCRPVSLYGFYYARIMAQKITGSVMRAVPMLLFAALLPEGWGICMPASVPLENITMAFTMRTLDPRGVQAMLNLLMMTLSGNILPLTLFPDRWQKVITLLPYAQLLDAPIRLYTGDTPAGAAAGILGIQAAWIVLLTALGIRLWNRHQRKIVLQGG